MLTPVTDRMDSNTAVRCRMGHADACAGWVMLTLVTYRMDPNTTVRCRMGHADPSDLQNGSKHVCKIQDAGSPL